MSGHQAGDTHTHTEENLCRHRENRQASPQEGLELDSNLEPSGSSTEIELDQVLPRSSFFFFFFLILEFVI